MLWKQHTGFKMQLLAILFLFFNCVCTAALVLKFNGENYKDAVSKSLVQVPNPVENEEENHSTASVYVSHFNHFSLRKQYDKRLDRPADGSSTTSFLAIDFPKAYLRDADVLPLPGYYAFLFRYNLF
jgi:hypothetical protein